jgi:hypothetical protein
MKQTIRLLAPLLRERCKATQSVAWRRESFVSPLALLLVATAPSCLRPTTAQATTIGSSSCADAEVVASIENQTADPIYEAWPKPQSNPVDTFAIFDLKVERVIYGRIAPGRVNVEMMAHADVYPKHKRVRMFLGYWPEGGWHVATCDFKP